MLSKGTSHKKVLDMFSAEITREKVKMNNKAGKKKEVDTTVTCLKVYMS